MSVSAAALREIVGRADVGRASVALAVAAGPRAEIQVTWRPAELDREPAFLAYSVTKTFTAVLMLRLAEDGVLALDDPVARWLPDVPAADRMSLRQLLRHTAGVPDYGGLPAYHEAVRRSPGQPWSSERFAAETVEKGLLFEPGRDWAYSNPGYMLLRRIVEECTGDTYAGLVRSRIAAPLGLERTFVAESVASLSALAEAPSTRLEADGRPVDTRRAYHPGWVAHGVVASTPSEIARLLHAVFVGGFLAPPSLRAMASAVPVPPRFVPPREGRARWREPGYGLGLMVDPASPWGALWGHNGEGPGYQASAFHAPDPGGPALSVCVMGATEREGVVEGLVRDALDCCVGARRGTG